MSAAKNDPAETLEALLSFLGAIALLAATLIARAWICSLYWAWFAVPFGAPALPWQVLLALTTWIGYTTHEARKEEDRLKLGELAVQLFNLHLFTLGVGWVLHASLRLGGPV